jgi:hypothetical protein
MIFFLILLMSIHQTHHIYNIALGKNNFEFFFIENSPVQPLPPPLPSPPPSPEPSPPPLPQKLRAKFWGLGSCCWRQGRMAGGSGGGQRRRQWQGLTFHIFLIKTELWLWVSLAGGRGGKQ